MATWLVTGGAGFIGANLVRRILADADARVVVLDKLTYAGHLESLAAMRSDPRFAFVQGDIADAETVTQVFRDRPPDAVLPRRPGAPPSWENVPTRSLTMTPPWSLVSSS